MNACTHLSLGFSARCRGAGAKAVKAFLPLLVPSLILACAAPTLSAPKKADKTILDACAKGDTARVSAILKADPTAVSVKGPNGATPLHYAVAGGHLEVMQALLAAKADPKARKTDGVTPLHVAAALGRNEMIKPLVQAGAEVNAKDMKGRTPVDLATQRKQFRTAGALIALGGEATPYRPPPVPKTVLGIPVYPGVISAASPKGFETSRIFISQDSPLTVEKFYQTKLGLNAPTSRTEMSGVPVAMYVSGQVSVSIAGVRNATGTTITIAPVRRGTP